MSLKESMVPTGTARQVNQEATPPHGVDAQFAGMKEQRMNCSCRASKCKC
ncbi:hypothetical protein QJS10_CPA06g00243 [Acorus calamus]|uniref:Metallothionein n=1 Tax=Acorus calamus TaxID=4465 RepID=A0AAV9EP82_ACOCL|nr:hypothetical protein QJS10_CPA06g00243 [Acorus calamus]